MGIIETLMQRCSEVYITGKFASFFYVSFDASVWGILQGWRDLYINGLQEKELFCANG